MLGHFQKNCRHFRKEKGGADGVHPKKISDSKNTLPFIMSEEELLFISTKGKVNLASYEFTLVVDLGTLFHLTLKRECFSSYTTRDYGYVKMGNDGACKIVGTGNVCLLTSTSYRMMLRDVCHVPGCTSCSGYQTEFDI